MCNIPSPLLGPLSYSLINYWQFSYILEPAVNLSWSVCHLTVHESVLLCYAKRHRIFFFFFFVILNDLVIANSSFIAKYRNLSHMIRVDCSSYLIPPCHDIDNI